MEAAEGQEVSGAKRWAFRPDTTDLQVNKQRGCSEEGHSDVSIGDGSRFER